MRGRFALLTALALAVSVPAVLSAQVVGDSDVKQDRKDVRHDRKDIRHDTRDIRQDRRDIRQDRNQASAWTPFNQSLQRRLFKGSTETEGADGLVAPAVEAD